MSMFVVDIEGESISSPVLLEPDDMPFVNKLDDFLNNLSFHEDSLLPSHN